MAFADLTKNTSPIPTNVCPICWIADPDKPERLAANDRDDLNAALRHTGVHFTRLSREFAKLGYKVTPDAVGRHAKGECPAGVSYR